MSGKALRRITLPVMQCDEGCGRCCGPVICKPHEFANVNRYAAERGIEPVAQGLTCPWYQHGQCQVYEVRPHVCRVYGHFAELNCPRGYNVNVSPTVQRRLEREYGATEKNLTRFLHEILLEKRPGQSLESVMGLTKEKTPCAP
jgi:Fe-S-cluster containining protein